MNEQPDAQVLQHHQQVVAATIAMATLADKREWARLESLFTPHVIADYTALSGGEAKPVPAADLVAGWKQTLETFTSTQHIVSNHEVKLHEGQAEVTAYFQATHCKSDGKLWILGGAYYYKLEHHAKQWLIAHLVMTPKWSQEANNTLKLPVAN